MTSSHLYSNLGLAHTTGRILPAKEILPVPWMKSLGVLWALSSQIDKDPIQVFLPPRGRDGQEKSCLHEGPWERRSLLPQ
jgi:hypothetical protein